MQTGRLSSCQTALRAGQPLQCPAKQCISELKYVMCMRWRGAEQCNAEQKGDKLGNSILPSIGPAAVGGPPRLGISSYLSDLHDGQGCYRNAHILTHCS